MRNNRLFLEKWLLNHFVIILGYPKEFFSLHSSIEDLGIESMGITALGHALEPYFPTLSKTFIYDCRTIGDVIDYLVNGFPDEVALLGSALHSADDANADSSELSGSPESSETMEIQFTEPVPLLDTWESLDPPEQAQLSDASDAIAIIGMAGRFPEAPDLEIFARNLAQGVNAIKEVPAERWSLDGFYLPDHTGRTAWASNSRWGGFVNDVDAFDAAFFGISARDADVMDPQERLFLECTWHALENAALGAERIPRDKDGIGLSVGTFVGVTTMSYGLLGPQLWQNGNGQVPTSMPWSIANRISYLHNFTGPSLAVDTACSSSLSALHLACASLRTGECSMAIAGGVNLYLHPSKYVQLSQQKMLSPTGQCHAFGVAADGFVPGEGVGAVILRPLKDALAAGDRVLGVIRASALQHGGRTNGYTIPNSLGQTALIRSVLSRAKIDAASITYVEAHGTGTSLGDPIEVDALSKAYGDTVQQPASCALGSVKSNIGHLESASGIAGLIKILLQFQHNVIFPTLHANRTNPAIDFSRSPFRIPVTLESWQRTSVPRRAALSSFGAGGANAHVLIDDGPMQAPLSCSSLVAQVMVFSATDDVQLRALVRQFSFWLTENRQQFEQPAELARLSYTLQLGRTALRHRLALVVRDCASLLEVLNEFIQREAIPNGNIRGCYTGVARAGVNTGMGADAGKNKTDNVLSDPDAVARAWVNTETVMWAHYWSIPLIPLALPGYPFARTRHWVAEVTAIQSSTHIQSQTKALDPGPFGTLSPESVSATISGSQHIQLDPGDWRVRDHVVNGECVFPAAAYLQLAADLAQAMGCKTPLAFRNLMWARAVVVTERADLHLAIADTGELVITEMTETTKTTGTIESSKGIKSGRAIIRGHVDTDLSAESGNVVSGSVFTAEKRSGIVPSAFTANEIDAFYARFERIGLHYGHHFRTVIALQRDGMHAVALLRSDVAGVTASWIDPSLLDGVFQCAVALAPTDIITGDRAFVPFSLKCMHLLRPLSGTVRVTISYTGSPATDLHTFDFHVENNAGEMVATVSELCFRVYQKATRTPASVSSEAPDPAWHLVVPVWSSRPELMPPLSPAPTSGAILMVGATDQLQHVLKAQLSVAMPAVTLWWLTPATQLRYRSGRLLEADPGDASQIEALFRMLGEEGAIPSHIVYCAGSGSAPETGNNGMSSLNSGTSSSGNVTPLQDVRRFASLVQTSVRRLGSAVLHLVYLYPHAASDLSPAASSCPYHQAVNGLLKTLHLEMPRVTGQVIGIDVAAPVFGDSAPDSAALTHVSAKEIVRALTSTSHQASISNRGDGNPGVQQLGWLESPTTHSLTWMPSRQAVYVITGGLGALGQLFGQWLTSQFGVCLALVGRSAVDADGERYIAALRLTGAQVVYFQGDITQREQAQRILADIRTYFGAINGVIHAAGVLRDAFFVQQSDADWRAVLAPKIDGTRHLDVLTCDDNIEAFVLFSSLAGVYGNVGQAVYAYANAWQAEFAQLRANAEKRQQRRGKTLAISWPLWKTETGMQAPQAVLEWMRERGLGLLEASEGLAAFQQAMSADSAHIVVCKGTRAGVGSLLNVTGSAVTPVTSRAATSLASSAASPVLPQTVTREAEIAIDTIIDATIQRLAMMLSTISGMKLERLVAGMPVQSLGLDSIMVMDMNAELEQHFKTLPKTLLYEVDTLRDLAMRLVDAEPDGIYGFIGISGVPASGAVGISGESGAQASAEGTVEHKPEPDFANAVESHSSAAVSPDAPGMRIAIVGIAGRYPKAADLRQFWRNLNEGVDCVVDIEQRWPDVANQNGSGDTPKSGTYAHWAALMDDIDVFDPLHFGIAPRDAERMDPQERLFLETAWLAVENAGYTPESLQYPHSLHGTRARVGVLAGVMYGEYQLYGAAGSPTPVNSSFAAIANRVSACLGLNGPSLALDSMCSSSLTALHLGCTLLRSGSCDAILAGGVNLSVHPYRYRMLSELQFAASDGRCRSFGEGGDGYVPGEGVGVVVLKRLEDAVRDGDHIYGVIRGSGIGHGGRTSGFTVPSPNAQAETIREAFQVAGTSLQQVGYVEAHGTGTSLGDPIEMRGLMLALGADAASDFRCPIGSVKSQIGHLESAAGIAALTKVLLQFTHRRFAASLHSERLNPNIDFASLPFFVQRESAPWPERVNAAGQVQPRLAAISSFGAGGSNAHLVVEDFPVVGTSSRPAGHQELFVFSARGAVQLRAVLQDVITLLDESGITPERAASIVINQSEFTISDVAATLREGRVAQPHRLAIIATDFFGLRTLLSRSLLSRALTDADWLAQEEDEAHGIYYGVAQASAEIATATPVDSELPLGQIARAWVTGALSSWPTPLAPLHACRRVPLPGTVLVKKRYWARPVPVGHQPVSLPVGVAASERIDHSVTTTVRHDSPRSVYEKVLRGELTSEQATVLLMQQIQHAQ